MFCFSCRFALIGCLACVIGIAAPPFVSLRAEMEGTVAESNASAETDRLTRTIRQLAERGAGDGDVSASDRREGRADGGGEQARESRLTSTSDDQLGRAEAELGETASAAIDPNELKPLGSEASSSDSDQQQRRFAYDGEDGWFLQTFMSLAVVVGLIFLLRWGWMRLGGGQTVSSTPVVEVLTRTAVAPRNHVLLLRVGQRILVVSDSGGGMRTLASVDDQQEVADLLAAVNASKADSLSRNFQQLLSRFGTTYDEARRGASGSGKLDWSDGDDGRDDAEHVYDRARDNVSGLASRIRGLARKGGEP